MIAALSKLLRSSKGAVALEYALIVSPVVIASMGALVAFGGSSTKPWRNVSAKVPDSNDRPKNRKKPTPL